MPHTTATKTIRVKRMNGDRVLVTIDDAQHYEVDIIFDNGNDDDWHMHHLIVRADSPRAAKAAITLREHQTFSGTRRLSHSEVAVLKLNGVEIL